MPPKVSALPRKAIERALCNTGVSAHDIRALLSSVGWCALESRDQQLAVGHDFVDAECGNTLTANLPGHAFALKALTSEKSAQKLERKRGISIDPPRSMKTRPLLLSLSSTTDTR
jgi:hypothetical protein